MFINFAKKVEAVPFYAIAMYRRHPVAFSCDKMTAIATIFPNSKVSPDEMIQTFFFGNPVVRDHTANGLAKLVAEQHRRVTEIH